MTILPTDFYQQINTDLRYWQQGLNLSHYQQSYEQQKVLFLQRLFLMLYHVGLLVKESPTSHFVYAKTSTLPLVCYLSHGLHINLHMEKTTFHDLLSFLCHGHLLEPTQPYQEQLYIAEHAAAAPLTGQLLYKHLATPKTNPLAWSITSQTAQKDYRLSWHPLLLQLKVDNQAQHKVRLTFSLHDYPHRCQFYTTTQPHPYLQFHKESEQAQGREFLIPHPTLGVKGELTQAELMYISQIPFSFDILAQPPTEHQEAELNSQILPPLDVFYQNLHAPIAQTYFKQFVQEKYQAYINIDISHYLARRDFINQWLGNNTESGASGLLKIQLALLDHQYLHYEVEQQKIIHAQLIEPLITLLVQELMAIVKLL